MASLGACRQAVRPAPPPPQPEVSYQAVDASNQAHYTLQRSQTAVGPVIDGRNQPPVYPPALVASGLPPVEVRAKLIVDREGRVSDVRFADAARADAQRHRFEAAVHDAAIAWRFTPLRIVQWAEQPDGSEIVTGSTAEPFSQDYLFRFELRHGKPVVTTAAPAASPPP
ncbi:MAG TPA: hypothetical protein VFG73_05020 [Rhodanobacteraceae bacterium]|nr:hypothetical protein [Rhodanobacteraceae bacterium]